MLENAGREADYICGFEESYGYLTGSYVRDKDAVNAAFMICEMFAFYKMHGLSLLDKLNEIYNTYGYCLNILHSYEFPGSAGMEKMQSVMFDSHKDLDEFTGMKVKRVEDYCLGLNGLPASDVFKYFYEGDGVNGSVVIRPSGTGPKLKVYISVTAENSRRRSGAADYRELGNVAMKDVHICPILMRTMIWTAGKCQEDYAEKDCLIESLTVSGALAKNMIQRLKRKLRRSMHERNNSRRWSRYKALSAHNGYIETAPACLR